LTFQGQPARFAKAEIDRAQLYGLRKLVAPDAGGHECQSALLTRDGRLHESFRHRRGSGDGFLPASSSSPDNRGIDLAVSRCGPRCGIRTWRSTAVPVAPGAGEQGCFGGIAEVAVDEQENPRNLTFSHSRLYWSGAGLWHLDPATSRAALVDLPRGGLAMVLVPERGPEVLGLTGQQEIVAFDPPSHRMRTLLPGRLMQRIQISGLAAADERYLYFTQSSSLSEHRGLFRLRRDGAGQPELLCHVPGSGWKFVVADGFVYYHGREQNGRFALLRRALVPDAPVEVLAELNKPAGNEVVRIVRGTAYYVADSALWSVAIDGHMPPVRHVSIGERGATDLLVDRECLYWSDGNVIRRAAIGGSGEGRGAEAIADGWTYGVAGRLDDAGELATDGHFLYWPDAAGERIMRLGRDPRPQPARPAVLAAPAAPQPRSPVTVDAIIVGDG
jgi:hypothetical protein